jgi:hypothetical protein
VNRALAGVLGTSEPKRGSSEGAGLSIKGASLNSGTSVEVEGLAPGTTAEDVAVRAFLKTTAYNVAYYLFYACCRKSSPNAVTFLNFVSFQRQLQLPFAFFFNLKPHKEPNRPSHSLTSKLQMGASLKCS